MADEAMIARLADLREFEELRAAFDERKEADVLKLGRQAFADPEHHAALEAHKLKAFHAGVDLALRYPQMLRDAARRRESK